MLALAGDAVTQAVGLGLVGVEREAALDLVEGLAELAVAGELLGLDVEGVGLTLAAPGKEAVAGAGADAFDVGGGAVGGRR